MEYAKVIKCKVSSIPKQLTFGADYKVLSETENGYQIEDKQGKICSFKKYMFEVVEWETE